MNLQHDRVLSIAKGRSRYDTHWRNQEEPWSAFVQRLSKTHRTAETHGEYLRSKRSRQDEIKDVGGFVGGFVATGRRKKGNISYRSMITLDLDFADMSVFESYKMLYPWTACIYSTHKHSRTKPRLRLVLPLAKDITSDKYEPISRKIAQWIGIEQFDDTTYQPERLMYWPSTSKDAEYYFDWADGPMLDPDAVLGEYYDWRDVSSWPVSSRVDVNMARAIKNQEDPLEKKGMIGAFNRAYTITEAIDTFLADVYTPCDVSDRYTYVNGSTTAGLVLYDDKFAYSHHGTDPCSMKLCNAFDLVRLHLYGPMDENATDDTPVNRLPSFKAMQELASSDKLAAREIVTERLKDAAEDFKDIDVSEILSEDWAHELDRNINGKEKSTIHNVITILQKDPGLKGALAYNEFTKRVTVQSNVPWRKIPEAGEKFVDNDESGLRYYMERMYNITGIKKIEDGLSLVTRQNAYHPVRDYLRGLSWDGTERVERLLVDYLGAEDTPYTRAVTRKSLTACVARIVRPGCKFDNVLTLVGEQGVGKSTLLARLGGPWFNDNVTLHNISKETADLIQGSWIIEFGELVGFKKAEAETMKNFISRTEDEYRKAYGRNTDIFPRQCVFFGTTNEQTFLKDPTGNRRWWPVRVGVTEPTLSVFAGLTQDVVDQIWAEAVVYNARRESLYLDLEMYLEAVTVQEQHNEHDERIGMIERFLEQPIPADWADMNIYDKREFLQRDADDARWDKVELRPRDKVCVAAVWCELFGGDPARLNRRESNVLVQCLEQIEGWQKDHSPTKHKPYGNARGFSRKLAVQEKCTATSRATNKKY